MKEPTKAQIEALGSDMEEMVRLTKDLGPPKPELLTNCGDGVQMPILTYPNPRLRDETGEVNFNEELRKLIADMAITMYAMGGVGIAAPQVGVPARVFLVDILNGQMPKKGPRSQLLVAVNPRLWLVPGKTVKNAERCLSFPDVVEIVERPRQVVLKAYDMNGNPYALGCTKDLSRAIQHEYDHIEGRLIIDYMKKSKRRDVLHRIKKYKPPRNYGLTMSRQ